MIGSEPDRSRFNSAHESEPDENDPGFCACGLGLDAYLHTDTQAYTSTPLTGTAWNMLRGNP